MIRVAFAFLAAEMAAGRSDRLPLAADNAEIGDRQPVGNHGAGRYVIPRKGRIFRTKENWVIQVETGGNGLGNRFVR
jgi:hypothetical protein